MLDATFFRRIGPNVRDRYRDHIFKKALDVFGKPFKAYTSKYGQRKKQTNLKDRLHNMLVLKHQY